MRPDISASNPNAPMARPHSKQKVKRNRWTHIEALNRRKEKSVDSVRSGINSKRELPVVRQVVTRLQELCKAVLAVDRVDAVASEGVKQDSEECPQPSVGKGDTEIAHSEVPDILNQRLELSDDTHSSRMYVSPLVSSEVLMKADSLIKVEICEPECLRQEENNLSDINGSEDIDLNKIIKKERELDVTGANTCIHNVVKGTVSCKTEPVDQLTDIRPLAEQTAVNGTNIGFVKNNDGPLPCATTGDLTVSEKGELLRNEICGNKALSDTSRDIVLHNLSRSDCQCCKAHDSIYSGPIKPESQPENYVIPAASEGLIDGIRFSGVSYSTDEDGGNCPVEIQKFSGPHFWMGKRKRVSGSLMSVSTEESLDSLVSSGTSVGESLPGLKNYSLKDEIPYSARNYEVVLPGDTDKLYYQEVYDSGSTSSSPDSRYAPSLVSDPNPYGSINRAQSWSPILLSVNNSGAVHSYMKSDAHIPFQAGARANSVLSGPLCEGVSVLQSVVPTSYTAMTVSSAPTASQEGTELGTENSDEELFKSIEESLAERETFKYQEEEILKRIERSLTETDSLKCREEQLLNKIERSLTEAKSLKSQEEDLLRRIEVSLGRREKAKSQGEGLLIGMKTSLQDTQYDILHVDSVNSMEFEAENKPDLDKSLPLKKRKKWLKAAASDANRSIPLESFPSFPLWPMISIAELEAFGKLQHRVSFPSFPSRPMISIAELETRAAFGKLRQHEFESSAVPPCISGYPHYCEENDFCDESFFSRDNGIGRTCDDFFEQNITAVENATAFPPHKVEDSSEGLGCSETSNDCASSRLRDCDMLYDKVFRKGEPSSAETSSSMCRDAAEDSKAHIKLLFGPATDCLSNMAKDSEGTVQAWEGTQRPPADQYMADTDCKVNRGHEVTVTGSECIRNNIEVLQRAVLSGSVMGVDSKSSTELDEEFETCLESKYIKVEKSSEGKMEDCALNYPPLTDVNSEASPVVSGCRKVDVTCRDSIERLSSTANVLDDSGQDLERNIQLQGKDEENVTFKAIKVETKDNIEWCKKMDVPLEGLKCTVDVESRDKDCL
jgi:hypothetical protein